MDDWQDSLDVLPLELFQPEDEQQMSTLMEALKLTPEVIHYLCVLL